MANEDILQALYNSGASVSRNRGPADLGQFEETLNRNDLYRQAAAPILGARFNTATWSPGQTTAVSFGQAFLGAALNALGNRSVANQMASVNSILPQLYANPSGYAAPDGVDSEAFQGLQSRLMQQKAVREADVGANIQNALGQRGFKYDPTDSTIAPMATKGGSAIEDLLSGDEKRKREDLMKKMISDEEDASRKEIAALPAVQQFQQTSTALARLDSLKDLTSKSSDLPFIYTMIQGLDGGVVKEGEVNMISGSNPILQAYKGKFEAAMNGGTELGVELKRQIVSELRGSQKALYSAAKEQSKPRLDLSLSRGGSQAGALPFNPGISFPEIAQTQQQVPPGMKLQRNRVTGATRLVPQ